MFSFPNPGQFFGPRDALAAYKDIGCTVGGGVVTVSVNKYRNANHSSPKSGCGAALTIKDLLRGVAPDAYVRAGGSVNFVEVFMGKGSPWAIAGVLETFAAHADAFIAKHAKSKNAAAARCAAILADDDITWEQTLQQLCDEYIGLDCNGFVGNWLKIVEPRFRLNQNHRADEVRTKAKVYRRKASEIEFWDLMCYAKNEHIAVVDHVNTVDSFAVCQSAGGGPRINDFKFLPAGDRLFRLAAPTANDIGYEFYVISLW